MTTLQFLRLEHGLKQPGLAKLSGVPQPTISLIENGRLNPSDDELERLGRAWAVAFRAQGGTSAATPPDWSARTLRREHAARLH